jgi:hypothetical protein
MKYLYEGIVRQNVDCHLIWPLLVAAGMLCCQYTFGDAIYQPESQ